MRIEGRVFPCHCLVGEKLTADIIIGVDFGKKYDGIIGIKENHTSYMEEDLPEILFSKEKRVNQKEK